MPGPACRKPAEPAANSPGFGKAEPFAAAAGWSAVPGRAGSEVLGIDVDSRRAPAPLLRGSDQAHTARRPHMPDGKTPNPVAAEHLQAKPKLANPAPHGRAGPCNATRARLIADRAKEISQPHSQATGRHPLGEVGASLN